MDQHQTSDQTTGKDAGKPQGQSWPEMAPECDPHQQMDQRQQAEGQQRAETEDHEYDDQTVTLSAQLQSIVLKEEIITMAKAAGVALEKFNEMINEQRNIIENMPNEHKQAAYESFFANPVVKVHYEYFARTVEKCNEMVQAMDVDEPAQDVQDQAKVQEAMTYAQITVQQAGPSSEPQAGPSGISRQRVQSDGPTAGMYIMQMKARTNEVINPVAAAYEALSKVRVHVAKTEQRGLDAKLRFFKRRDYELALEKIKAHEVNQTTLGELYDFSLMVSSLHSIRTDATTIGAVNRMPFIKDGQVDQKQAAQVLYMRNPSWFKTMADIEYVEKHTVPQCQGNKYLFEIHMSKEAHQRINRAEGNATIDLVTVRLTAHDAVKPEECFRCLQPGHVIRQCKAEESQCKYCTGRHLSIGCAYKSQPEKHVCYKCVQANAQAPEGARMLDVRHMATSTRCKYVRGRRQDMKQKAKAKARKRRNV